MNLKVSLTETLLRAATFLRTAVRREPSYELLPTQSNHNMAGDEPTSKLPSILLNGRVAKRGAMVAASLALVCIATYWWRQLPDYHGLPNYKDVWKAQRSLPQLDPSLPWPEGRNGRYVKFSVPYHHIGFNNQFQDILMASQIAYMSNRGYAFQNYMWNISTTDPVVDDGGRWRSAVIPLQAFFGGPVGGSEIGPSFNSSISTNSPRFVTWEYFDSICPPERTTYLNVRFLREQYGIKEDTFPNGKKIVEAFSDALTKLNETCVDIGADHIFTFDAFGSRIVPAFDLMRDSPILSKFEWAPLVRKVVTRNMNLLSAATQIDASAPEELSGLLAVHLRRGDFIEHCQNLYHWKAGYNGWNTFPEFQDAFADLIRNRPQDQLAQIYADACLPTVGQLVSRINAVRGQWERSALTGKARKLDRIYLLTNAESEYRNELHSTLLQHGWLNVATSYDLKLAKPELEVDMTADMMIGQMAEVFLGNGFSSLTANINLLRMARKVDTTSIRFLAG